MIIKVKKYMTQKSTPGFDFMAKFNNDNPMPYMIMTGEVEKRTAKMVYMKLHADILKKVNTTCICCGKPITNKVSQYFGIGPICGKHNYVNPFDSEEELNNAVEEYRKQLLNVKWEGWIPLSAIEVIEGDDIKEEESQKDIDITLDIKDDVIVVSFEYNADVVTKIRSVPNRKYNPDTKNWEVPIDNIDMLKLALTNYNITINGTIPEKEVIETVKGFEYKTKPFSHQVDAFQYGLNKDKWLLGDEQGLGKTKTVIDIAVAKKVQNNYKHCLIICGVNGLKWNWVNEVKTHSNESAYILGQRVKNKKLKIGSMSDRIDDLKRLNEIDDYFIITNVETLRNDEIIALINKSDIDMICADEVHKMKNPQSQQGKGFLKLKAETMIAMSGTPLMNNPLDLYIILKWLGYENHSFYNFKNHYCVMGGYGDYEIVGYKNLDQLQMQLNNMMLRRLKDDVLDLPEKTYIDEYVDMTPKQEKIYKEVTSEIKTNIDLIKSAPNPLSEMIRMRQATGYTGILSSNVCESAKLDRMAEIVEDALKNNKKVVIFSNWTQMTDAIDNRLAEIKMPNTHAYVSSYTALITGETKDELRQDIVNAFQNTDELRVLVGTIGAMGTGLTLTEGTVEIFLDHPWNMAHYEQAVDRCHRIGQTKNITIYNLMCKDTIDERIWELVKQKGALSDVIIDGADVSSKSDLVDFLLS